MYGHVTRQPRSEATSLRVYELYYSSRRSQRHTPEVYAARKFRSANTRKSCAVILCSLRLTVTLNAYLSLSHHLLNTSASQPLYLSEFISRYLCRSLRSSNTNFLTRPAGITSNFSSRAFSVSAPSTWNSLPAHIRSIDTLSTFKSHLKFHLFQSAFTV